jgi:hypothetical protein
MIFKKEPSGKLKLTPENIAALGPIGPDVVSLAVTRDTSISSSTEITLNKLTSIVTVSAIAKDVYLKWGTADVTNANMDEIIPAGRTMNFVVPDGITALNVIEESASATVIVIEK